MDIGTYLEWGVLLFAGISAAFWLVGSRIPKHANEMKSTFGDVIGVIVYRDFKVLTKAARWNKLAAVFAGLAVIDQILLNFVS